MSRAWPGPDRLSRPAAAAPRSQVAVPDAVQTKPIALPPRTETATVAPPPVTSSAPAPATDPVLLDRPHEGTPAGVPIALAVLALGLLLVLLLLAARRFDRFPGARHAWGEAAYRAGGTWGDFVDWVRFGR